MAVGKAVHSMADITPRAAAICLQTPTTTLTLILILLIIPGLAELTAAGVVLLLKDVAFCEGRLDAAPQGAGLGDTVAYANIFPVFSWMGVSTQSWGEVVSLVKRKKKRLTGMTSFGNEKMLEKKRMLYLLLYGEWLFYLQAAMGVEQLLEPSIFHFKESTQATAKRGHLSRMEETLNRRGLKNANTFSLDILQAHVILRVRRSEKKTLHGVSSMIKEKVTALNKTPTGTLTVYLYTTSQAPHHGGMLVVVEVDGTVGSLSMRNPTFMAVKWRRRCGAVFGWTPAFSSSSYTPIRI
ncbi:hypothetical protein BDZ97DRAFT_1765517 [Flammula alnicola]|nr:hypothetical protein BDZ97DRAFT_1765517 [Flammula alnicola]